MILELIFIRKYFQVLLLDRELDTSLRATETPQTTGTRRKETMEREMATTFLPDTFVREASSVLLLELADSSSR